MRIPFRTSATRIPVSLIIMKLFSLTTIALFQAISFSSLYGGGNLALNQVWSRLADIHGEYGSVESAEFSPDSEYIVSGTKFDYTVRVFRTADGHQLWVTKLSSEIERVAWTQDGRFVVAVSEDFMMRVLDAKTGTVVKEMLHENGIDGLASSNNGKYMVSGQEENDDSGPVHVYSTDDWSLVRKLDHGDTVNEVDFTSDDKYFITSGHKYVKVWETESGKLIRVFDIDPSFLDHLFINVNVHPDDRWVAAGTNQGYIYLFDLEKMKLVRRVNKLGQKIETVAWTIDGGYLATAGHSDTIDFFATKHLLDKSLKNDSIPFALRVPVSDNLEYMEFDDYGSLMTTAHQDGTVQLWTYMSDDPSINERRHREVKAIQTREAAKKK